MSESDRVLFAAAGFVPIPALDRVNELAETWSAKRPAVYKRSGTGGRAVRITSSRGGSETVESKTDRLNRYDYRHR